MDFSSALHFLFDRTRNLASKAIFIFLAALILFIFDNTFSFSYYYNTSQKISQIRDIKESLSDPTLNELEKQKLIQLRNAIIEHRTFKDLTYDYLTNLHFDTSNQTSEETKFIKLRNPTIHLLTSAWWIIIPLVIFGIALPFLLLSEKKQIFVTFLGYTFICTFGYLVSLVLSKVLSFIPLINNTPLYNYILNFIISGIILLIIIAIIKKVNKNSSPSANV